LLGHSGFSPCLRRLPLWSSAHYKSLGGKEV
jgi:hypothetical protein